MHEQAARIAAIALLTVSVLWSAEIPCLAGESSGPTGTLRITGTGVQKLQLTDAGGILHSVEVIDGTVELSPSTYTIREIHLTNGFYSRTPKQSKVEVTDSAETTFEVGGPLTQKIEAKRQGCMLVLSSFTEGVGGIRYAGRPAGVDPPRFEVYKGDRKIDDGEFEYG